jgi:hypothetical protein
MHTRGLRTHSTANTILPSIEAEIAPHHIPSKQPLTAWGTLSVMVLIYAVAFAGTALLAFNTVQRLRIADTVKLGDEN